MLGNGQGFFNALGGGFDNINSLQKRNSMPANFMKINKEINTNYIPTGNTSEIPPKNNANPTMFNPALNSVNFDFNANNSFAMIPQQGGLFQNSANTVSQQPNYKQSTTNLGNTNS